jgi:hypothetical protein
MTVLVKTKHIDKRFNYARVPDGKLPEVEAEWNSTKVCVRMRESVTGPETRYLVGVIIS